MSAKEEEVYYHEAVNYEDVLAIDENQMTMKCDVMAEEFGPVTVETSKAYVESKGGRLGYQDEL